MRRWALLLAVWAGFGMGEAIAAPASEPTIAAPPENPPQVSQNSVERLTQMFSPEIQSIVAACWESGKVNLSPSLATRPWVVCGDGSQVEGITYDRYRDTMADVISASTLVALQGAIARDPRVSPETLALLATSDQGQQLLRDTSAAAIVQSGLQTPDQPESTRVLADAMMLRMVAYLRNPDWMNTFLGTPQQYSQVVAQFCTAPGMSLEESAQQFPTLDSVQLFAICIDESDAMTDVLP